MGGRIMKIILTEQFESTFGQTQAGAHVATTPEWVLAEVDAFNATMEEIDDFMNRARPVVHVPRRSGGGSLELPLSRDPDGFAAMKAVMRQREGVHDAPFVRSTFGPYRIRLVGSTWCPDDGGVEMDPTNRAYQREVLGV